MKLCLMHDLDHIKGFSHIAHKEKHDILLNSQNVVVVHDISASVSLHSLLHWLLMFKNISISRLKQAVDWS